MSDILIIVPVRGRPHSVAPLWETWLATTDNADLLLAADEDDPTLEQYREAVAETEITLRVGPREWTAPKSNTVAAEHWDRYPMIGFWGDDNRPRTRHWDTRLTDELRRMGTGLAYANDLLQREKLPCSVVMTSNIPRTLGYMAFPGTLHLCIDVAWKDWGEGIGRLSYLDDVVIEHMHPANGKAAMDAIYAAGNSPERVEKDSAAYYRYREGRLIDDVAKLRSLL